MNREEKIKQLKEQRLKLLLHMVGMTYYMEEVLKINEQIKKLERK